MPHSKIIRVFDRMTDMLFIITKFDPKDTELLLSEGWEYSPELTMITSLGAQVGSALSTFTYPKHDIPARSTILNFNHTTNALASVVRNLLFDEFPNEIDVTGMEMVEK